jgi:putative glutamine amidotransferase
MQAIHQLAPHFEQTAVSEDGVIEAIELKVERFVVGVQWHPETLALRMPEHMALFREFVKECDTYQQEKEKNHEIDIVVGS